jgi:hypothetical protein
MYWLLALALAAVIYRFGPPLDSSRRLYAVCSASKNIYTVDAQQSRAECIVIRHDKIALVSDRSTLKVHSVLL